MPYSRDRQSSQQIDLYPTARLHLLSQELTGVLPHTQQDISSYHRSFLASEYSAIRASEVHFGCPKTGQCERLSCPKTGQCTSFFAWPLSKNWTTVHPFSVVALSKNWTDIQHIARCMLESWGFFPVKTEPIQIRESRCPSTLPFDHSRRD